MALKLRKYLKLVILVGIIILLVFSTIGGSFWYYKDSLALKDKEKTASTQYNDLEMRLLALKKTDKEISGFTNYIPDNSPGLTLLLNMKLAMEKIGDANILKVEPLSANLTNDGKITQIPVTLSFTTSESSLLDFFRFFSKTYPEPLFQDLKLNYKKGVLSATVTMLSTSVSVAPSKNSQPDSILSSISSMPDNNSIFGVIYDYDKQLADTSSSSSLTLQGHSSTSKPDNSKIVIGGNTGGDANDPTVNNVMGSYSTALKTSTQIGQWFWPLKDYHDVSCGFGPRINPITQVKEIHYGSDIPCPTGTQVYASVSGVASFVGNDDVYGNYVILSEKNTNIKFLYGHLSKIAIKEGQSVSAEDIIGESGSTGESTGPHLHLGISINGEYVDAMSLMK